MSTTTDATALEVRQGIADAIKRGVDGMQASPYILGNFHPPHAHVVRGPVQYDQAFEGGAHNWTFLVRAFAASVSDIGAQMKLDELLAPEGDRSIKAAIEADTTLGGVVSDLHVTQATGEQEYVRDQGGPLLFSEWTVEVLL